MNMVKVFNRSVSFPNKTVTPKPAMSHHIRSISLPTRSHPLISQLRDEINGLSAWYGEPESRNTAWLCDGLTRLKRVHDFLDDLLQLRQTQESLRRQPRWVENLLEDFIRLVDVYGIFQTAVLSLREDHSAAQAAVRRRDESKVAFYVKSRATIAKQLARLASTVREPWMRVSRSAAQQAADPELADIINDAVEVTKTVSNALLKGISTSWKGSRKSLWRKAKLDESILEFERVDLESLSGLKRMGEEEVAAVSLKMKELETCMVMLENGSGRVFRGLMNARVSLLNSLTQ